jgi:hypothetical protein
MTGRSGGSAWRRAAASSPEGGSAVTLATLGAAGEDEGGEGSPKMENGGGLGGSHRGGRGMATAEKLVRGVAILASAAGGLSHGRTGEAAACLSSGEREQSDKGERGPARCRVGAVLERRGRGQGTAPFEPARHGRSGSGPLRQRRAAHVVWVRRTCANR